MSLKLWVHLVISLTFLILFFVSVAMAVGTPEEEIALSEQLLADIQAGRLADGPDRSAVDVQVTPDSVSVGLDLLGIRDYRASDWARDVWMPLRLITYPLDYAGYMVTEHPWQSVAVVAVGYEASTGNLSKWGKEAIDGITGNDDDDDKPRPTPTPTPTPSSGQSGGMYSIITGDGNTVTQTRIDQYNFVPKPTPTPEVEQ